VTDFITAKFTQFSLSQNAENERVVHTPQLPELSQKDRVAVFTARSTVIT